MNPENHLLEYGLDENTYTMGTTVFNIIKKKKNTFTYYGISITISKRRTFGVIMHVLKITSRRYLFTEKCSKLTIYLHNNLLCQSKKKQFSRAGQNH